jgi:hypothetical protein
MKLIREFDDFSWTNMGTLNPFMSDDPLVVVWLDKSATESEINKLYDMLLEVNIEISTSKSDFVKSLLTYSRNGSAYVKSYIAQNGEKRAGYGDTKALFDEHKYWKAMEDLDGKPYIEYKLGDIFKDRLNESEELNWIIESNPSFRNKIIIFEPLIIEDEYNIVIDGLLEFDEDLYTYSGNLEELRPFTSYDYLHHLVIGLNGVVAYGGANEHNNEDWGGFMDNVENYIGNYYKNFNNPEVIDGRKYFNL